VNSQTLELNATVRTTLAAGDADATIQIRFNGTNVARVQVRYVRGQRHDFNAQFVSENSRIGKERLVTLEGVDVRSTDTDATNPHHGLAWQRPCRRLRFRKLKLARFVENDGFHAL
jgi:hypothetical protein